jgi:hypothetical protein
MSGRVGTAPARRAAIRRCGAGALPTLRDLGCGSAGACLSGDISYVLGVPGFASPFNNYENAMSRPANDRGISFSISQLISALDDRNIVRAIRVLEPAANSSDPSSKDQDAPRCERCITRGE